MLQAATVDTPRAVFELDAWQRQLTRTLIGRALADVGPPLVDYHCGRNPGCVDPWNGRACRQ